MFLVHYLRDEILRAEDILSKKEGIKGNDADFARGYWRGRASLCVDALRKLVESGVEFTPDVALMVEAETLIPKGGFWAGHELNRILRHYQEDFKKKDFRACALNERILRRGIVKARLEVNKIPS